MGLAHRGLPESSEYFSSSRPEVWALQKDGSPWLFMGPLASVHHPATYEMYVESLERLFSFAPVRGIVWDELKALQKRDYSPMAREALKDKDIENMDVHVDAQADFFEKVNTAALKMNPDLKITMFLFGHLNGYEVGRCAQISNLHGFGLDGRPFRLEDGGSNDSGGTKRLEDRGKKDSRGGKAYKTLCDHGPFFMDAAHANNKDAFMLIENHAMKSHDIDLMDRRLPEILALKAEHMCYYYYPRSVSEPDRAMNVLAKHLKNAK